MMKSIKQRGLTLLEITAGLVIIALAGVAIASFASGAIRDSKVEKNSTVLSQVEQSIRRVYTNKNNFAGLSDAALANSGLLPDSITNGASIRGPYGTVRVWPISIGCGGCNDGFAITFLNVPSDVCLKFASRDYGTRLNNLLVAPTTSTSYTSVMGNISTAATRCRAADELRLQFQYRK